MPSTGKTIREFIYLDADRLNSLYSQVFEGVAEEIVKSRLHGELQKETQKGEITKGQIAEAQFAELNQTTENKVLYDYMYSQLEAKILPGILIPTGITAANFRDVLRDAFMLKVTGRTEIADYNRIKTFATDFNELAGKLAFAETVTQLGVSLYKLESFVETAKGDQKGELRKVVNRFKNSTQLAKEKGYYQDEELMSLIQLVTQMFYPEGFETTICPSEGIEGVVFRGVLDKRWLRLQPDLLKALYGGYTEFDWTMVGEITYLPGGEPIRISPMITPNLSATSSPSASVSANTSTGSSESVESDTDESLPSDESTRINESVPAPDQPAELPSMRDPFRTAFSGLTALERMFLESKERVEVIMHPLAIYRETTLATA